MNKDELDCLKDFSVFTHNTLSLSNRECREREREIAREPRSSGKNVENGSYRVDYCVVAPCRQSTPLRSTWSAPPSPDPCTTTTADDFGHSEP
jgi:hypothetical protein